MSIHNSDCDLFGYVSNWSIEFHLIFWTFFGKIWFFTNYFCLKNIIFLLAYFFHAFNNSIKILSKKNFLRKTIFFRTKLFFNEIVLNLEICLLSLVRYFTVWWEIFFESSALQSVSGLCSMFSDISFLQQSSWS